MIVQMPFIQRYVGRTPNRAEIRPLAAWDTERMELPELSRSDFEPGSSLGDDIHTLYRDGGHWAYYGTRVTGKLDYRKLDMQGMERALDTLAFAIDMTRFFDEGRIDMRVSGTPSHPPHSKWTESSQRESNVNRLVAWVNDNVAMIDGHLAVRVGEPSIQVWVSEANSKGYFALFAERAPLIPKLAVPPAGIHFGLDEMSEIGEMMQKWVSSHQHLDFSRFIEDTATRDTMGMFAPSRELMQHRSIISIAHDAVRSSLYGKGSKAKTPVQADLRELLSGNDRESSDTDLDKMMECLLDLRGHVGKTAILIDIQEEMWNDRPISGPSQYLRHRMP